MSAVKSAVGQAGYSLGPALFALVGTILFTHDAMRKLAGTDITLAQAREALRAAHGTSVSSTGGVGVIDPQRAREVVEGATESMIHAIHTLSLIMAAVPVVAIVRCPDPAATGKLSQSGLTAKAVVARSGHDGAA